MTRNERIREMLGWSMEAAARKERERKPVKPIQQQKPVERRKEREGER